MEGLHPDGQAANQTNNEGNDAIGTEQAAAHSPYLPLPATKYMMAEKGGTVHFHVSYNRVGNQNVLVICDPNFALFDVWRMYVTVGPTLHDAPKTTI